MTQSTAADRALLIKKLLNKAEAKGTTEAERDALNAKATELMIKWRVEEAMLADVDRTKIENIVQRQVATDVPKSYSYEYTCIGIDAAEALGCRGFLQRQRDGRTNLTIVGFESDVLHVVELYRSLVLQCTLSLATGYASVGWRSYHSGTEKYQWKRSFILGFAAAIRTKLTAVKQQVIDETPGTDLVLVDRTARVDSYITTEMQIGAAGRRRYYDSGLDAGRAAGQRASVGGSAVGSHSDRSQLGG